MQFATEKHQNIKEISISYSFLNHILHSPSYSISIIARWIANRKISTDFDNISTHFLSVLETALPSYIVTRKKRIFYYFRSTLMFISDRVNFVIWNMMTMFTWMLRVPTQINKVRLSVISNWPAVTECSWCVAWLALHFKWQWRQEIYEILAKWVKQNRLSEVHE